MPDPTPNCPDPEAPDFLRCLATWEAKDALTVSVPYVVIYRCIDALGNVDAARLAREIKKYRHRPKPRNPIYKQGE
jgi:hypothetical protein